MKPITVLLADDTALVRKSYVKLLKAEADLAVVGEAKTGWRRSRWLKSCDLTWC